jgi:hypothetical protein
VLNEADAFIATAQQRLAEGMDPIACVHPAMTAMVLTGTAEAFLEA